MYHVKRTDNCSSLVMQKFGKNPYLVPAYNGWVCTSKNFFARSPLCKPPGDSYQQVKASLNTACLHYYQREVKAGRDPYARVTNAGGSGKTCRDSILAYEQTMHNNRARRLLGNLDAGSRATQTKLKSGVTETDLYNAHRTFSHTAHPQGAFWIPAGNRNHTGLTTIRDEVYSDLAKRYSGLSDDDVIRATSPSRLAANVTEPLFELDAGVSDDSIDLSLGTNDDSALLIKTLFPNNLVAANTASTDNTPEFRSALVRAAATPNDALQLRRIVLKALLAYTSGLVRRPVRTVAQFKQLSSADLARIHKLLEDRINPTIKSERGRRLAGQGYSGMSAAASLNARLTLSGSMLIEGVPVQGSLRFVVPLVWATADKNSSDQGGFGSIDSIFLRVKQGKTWGFNLVAAVGVKPADLIGEAGRLRSALNGISDYVPRWAFPIARTFIASDAAGELEADAEVEFGAQFEAATDRTAIRVNGAHAGIALDWAGKGLPAVGKTQENAALQEAERLMSFMDVAPGPRGWVNLLEQAEWPLSSDLSTFWNHDTTREEFERGFNLARSAANSAISLQQFSLNEINAFKFGIYNPNVNTTQSNSGPWHPGWVGGWPTFLVGGGVTSQQGAKASLAYNKGAFSLGVDFRLYFAEKLDVAAGTAAGVALDRAGYDDGLISK